ncbi:hypothetical protein C4572_02055 [Candidatus Parcubacteria bacterium]|nr:MAG: hypothetical protein C4572_02055 [Candidatus Parcubacteria bacterium]
MYKFFKKIFKFFDRTEDKTRSRLSKHPLVYATIGAVGLVLLWRGVWMVADTLSPFDGVSFDRKVFMDGFISIGISLIVLLGSGLFVSFFIGDRIILSGLKKEKKLEEKTKEELDKELNIINEVKEKMDKIGSDIEQIKRSVENKNT